MFINSYVCLRYIRLILQNSVLLCYQEYTFVLTGWPQHSVQSPPPFKNLIHANTTRHPLVPLISYRSPIIIHNEFVLTLLGLICCFVHNKLYVRSTSLGFIAVRTIFEPYSIGRNSGRNTCNLNYARTGLMYHNIPNV